MREDVVLEVNDSPLLLCAGQLTKAAAFIPSWSSKTTSFTPEMPRSMRPRSSEAYAAPFSEARYLDGQDLPQALFVHPNARQGSAMLITLGPQRTFR